MLASTRRSHNLSRLEYSSTHDTSHYVKLHDHIASTSKNYISHHFRKVHHNYNKYHYAPHSNRYHHMHHRNNHIGICYRNVGMTAARYEMLNRKSDFTIFHDVQNAYRRFRHGITIQPKDFQTKWILKSKPIRLKVI